MGILDDMPESQEDNLPQVLPLLVLRNAVVFPATYSRTIRLIYPFGT